MKDDNIQNAICTHCEDTILGCKHSTSTFLCEGRYCDQAEETFYDINTSIEDVNSKLDEVLSYDSSLIISIKSKLEEFGSQSIPELNPKHYYSVWSYLVQLIESDRDKTDEFERARPMSKEEFEKKYPPTPEECFNTTGFLPIDRNTVVAKQKQIFLLGEFEPIRVSEYKETNINF